MLRRRAAERRRVVRVRRRAPSPATSGRDTARRCRRTGSRAPPRRASPTVLLPLPPGPSMLTTSPRRPVAALACRQRSSWPRSAPVSGRTSPMRHAGSGAACRYGAGRVAARAPDRAEHSPHLALHALLERRPVPDEVRAPTRRAARPAAVPRPRRRRRSARRAVPSSSSMPRSSVARCSSSLRLASSPTAYSRSTPWRGWSMRCAHAPSLVSSSRPSESRSSRPTGYSRARHRAAPRARGRAPSARRGGRSPCSSRPAGLARAGRGAAAAAGDGAAVDGRARRGRIDAAGRSPAATPLTCDASRDHELLGLAPRRDTGVGQRLVNATRAHSLEPLRGLGSSDGRSSSDVRPKRSRKSKPVP